MAYDTFETLNPMETSGFCPDQNSEESKPNADVPAFEDGEAPKSKPKPKKSPKTLNPHRITKPFRPIIMMLMCVLVLGIGVLQAQIEGSVTLGAQYTDNVFSLSDYDFDRYNQNNDLLDFVETTDDLNLHGRIDLRYPVRYRWWRFVPSVTTSLARNLSNTEKYRNDVLTRLQVERYHWNATVLYGYYPHIYVRDYVDSDGTGELEKYSYERNLYRADANFRVTRSSTLRLHGRYENYYYNEYWTQFDGDAYTYGIGFRHSFPVFIINGMYYYRIFENDFTAGSGFNDSSYESDRYDVGIMLKQMPLNESKKDGVTWRPALNISYEERFYQGLDSWYGGRIDKVYNTKGSLDFFFSSDWNLSLDYSHIFRNVDSPNASVLRLKEYTDNRLGASVRYNF